MDWLQVGGDERVLVEGTGDTVGTSSDIPTTAAASTAELSELGIQNLSDRPGLASDLWHDLGRFIVPSCVSLSHSEKEKKAYNKFYSWFKVSFQDCRPFERCLLFSSTRQPPAPQSLGSPPRAVGKKTGFGAGVHLPSRVPMRT